MKPFVSDFLFTVHFLIANLCDKAFVYVAFLCFYIIKHSALTCTTPLSLLKCCERKPNPSCGHFVVLVEVFRVLEKIYD